VTLGERLLSRETSWLAFNERVLAMAEDGSTPLLERVRFCAICSSNLDEFFQVRVAGLHDQVAAGVHRLSADGRSPAEHLAEIRHRVEALLAAQSTVFVDQIIPALAGAAVVFTRWADLPADDHKALTEEFHERLFPILTPLAVDPSHPFPYISSLSLNLAVVMRRPGEDLRRFARVKVPPLLPRFKVLDDGTRVIPIEEILGAHLDLLFPGVEILSWHAFRVTRNADLTIDDEEEADDLLAAVEMELRRRFKRAVRLEVAEGMPPDVRTLLLDELELAPEDLYEVRGPLDLSGLSGLANLGRPDLCHPELEPTPVPAFAAAEQGADLFVQLARGDVLVHHPYHSFVATTEAFVARAADDPRVQAIKATLYRTSGDSPIVASLIRAAERGKQVAVIIELKARFDEQANIDWARRLEEAGVHVVYGIVGLKTHAKAILVVRSEDEGLRRYAHIGTGNYNAGTARSYEDLALFTTDPAIGADLSNLFNALTGFGLEPHFDRLLVAPHALRGAVIDLIEGECAAGPGGGRIVMKMNSLVDPAVIDALYLASGAGVEIDLIVRGICCLVPGVVGQSERIRVRSIIGRYLEHSRIYHFANGSGPGRPLWLVGSADLMPRNLERRVEVLTPITNPAALDHLRHVVDINLGDNRLAWALGPDGKWRRVSEGEVPLDTHLALHELLDRPARPDWP
jgi:polyphosphate kinase